MGLEADGPLVMATYDTDSMSAFIGISVLEDDLLKFKDDFSQYH